MKWRKVKHDLECFFVDKYYDIRRPIVRIHDFIRYEIPYGVKNLIRWFPMIWEDRDWDFLYMLHLLKQKLVFMSDSIERCGNHVDHMKDVRQMRACIKLIDKILNDEYGYIEAHEKKWGALSLTFEPAYDHETGEQNPHLCKMVSNRANALFPKDREQELEEYRIALTKEDQANRRISKALFLIINKNYRRWWD